MACSQENSCIANVYVTSIYRHHSWAPESSSTHTLNCPTGVEGCPLRRTPLHHKLQHSGFWPRWITMGGTNPGKKPLISLVWNATGAVEGVYIFCYCQYSVYSNRSYCQANINCGSSRHVSQIIEYSMVVCSLALSPSLSPPPGLHCPQKKTLMRLYDLHIILILI